MDKFQQTICRIIWRLNLAILVVTPLLIVIFVLTGKGGALDYDQSLRWDLLPFAVRLFG